MNYLADFFAGAFLCNCIPHLAAALQGMPFPSPFAKPPGKGDSAPVVNFLWGAFNLLSGLVLLSRNPVIIDMNGAFSALVLGFIILGLQLSLHFGKVQRDKSAR